ncbi:MAG TPA: hypothetical protein VM889_03045 [Candidatus Thermoplasmatota archaeon]|nr:hypothetical protein [Candidatus Thermoplasmatota archaeon]
MRSHRSWASPLLIGGVVLTLGCLSAIQVDDDRPRCAFRYPNGDPIPCESQATLLDVHTLPPPAGWLCVESLAMPKVKVSLWRHAASGDRAFGYTYEEFAPPFEGLLAIDPPHGRMLTWKSPTASGFVPIGPVGDATRLVAMLYRTTVTHDRGAEHRPTLDHLWSAHDELPWLLYRVSVGERTHVFDPMREGPSGWTPAPLEAERDGVRYAFDHVSSGGFLMSSGGGAPRAGC